MTSEPCNDLCKSSEHMLHYYWLRIKSRLGHTCCYIDVHFDYVSFDRGRYNGTGAVVGSPAIIFRDQAPLLTRLDKYKRRRQSILLTISECGYDYRLDSGLRVVISRGAKGILFEGDQRLARIEGPSTAWLALEPKGFKYV